MKSLSFVILTLCLLSVSQTAFASEPTSPEDVFAQRILPILNSPNPSSCVQCHLAAVDLKDYILPSAERTFANLRAQGLIDVNSPKDSKILNLIAMGERDLDKKARMIHAKVRDAELQAFESWLLACCTDRKFLDLPVDASDAFGPKVTDEVIRHNRKDRVLDSFERNVWSQRMRCFPCHTPNEIDPNDPKHATPKQRYEEYLAQYGQRMNLFRETPQATMAAMIQSSSLRHKDSLPLLNVESPSQSLLILKPTSKVPPKDSAGVQEKPSSNGTVTHIGGLKMHEDDFSYKAFMGWLTDYAKINSGQYQSDSDLPSDNWFPTQLVVRVTGTPDSWQPLSVVQIFVHSWDDKTGSYSSDPIAFTQTRVGPRGMAIGSLFLLGDAAQRETWATADQLLPAGKYQLVAYLDPQDRLSADPSAFLNDQPHAGKAEIEAKWTAGFPNAEQLPGTQFQQIPVE
ncbi:MAG: hypothetical protein KDB22_14080 [Planctomycetales bacterium]|nr:hypothetical protein [Planctomycetales bacterium]